VLEAGCGVGAQTVTLARQSPEARITAIDISERSLRRAHERVEAAGLTNVALQQADLFDLPFPSASFDHVFVCFVMEHLAAPKRALTVLKQQLLPGSTMTVIEGDHGSTSFYPESEAAHLSASAGGRARRRRGLLLHLFQSLRHPH
jgi:ubiquinone/menaquinone biosynthesis C-methylase UbiE